MAQPYVFVSYASTDGARASRVAKLLEAAGVSVWLDRSAIAGGASWSGEIVRAIRDCTALLVLSSPAAMRSANVRQELQLAWDRGRPCLPVVLEQTPYPDEVEYLLAGRHWIELLDRPEEDWLPEVLHALGRLGVPAANGAAEPASGELAAGVGAQAAAAAQPSDRPARHRMLLGIGVAVLLLAGLLGAAIKLGLRGSAEKSSQVKTSGSGQRAAAVTSTLSVYAGTGQAGHMNGPRALAQFSSPEGLNISAEGSDLVVADPGNEVLRYIRGSGLVEDLCGTGSKGYADGPCATAQFSDPLLLGRGSDQTVYVGDTGNLRIRAISPGGVVSTLAGSGIKGFADGEGAAAQFAVVSGIDVDQRTGILYLADTGNHRIRRITPAGVVTTFAGSGAPGYVDGPATVAQFNAPRGVNVDTKGNVYVHDAGNHRIRKIAPDGVVSTLAGAGVIGFADGPGPQAQFGGGTIGTTTDAVSGNFYMMDAGNKRIRKITPDGVVSTVFEFTDPDQTPFNIRISPAGDVYVSDPSHNRIYKITGIVNR